MTNACDNPTPAVPGIATSDHRLRSRFRGSILGAALADGLAFPYQHYSRAFLRSLAAPLTAEFAEHHSGFYPRGQYSGQTQEMLAVLHAIVERERVDGEAVLGYLAPLWRDNLLLEPDRTRADRERRGKGVGGQRSGLEAPAEAAPLRRVVPIALWEHRDPEGLHEAIQSSIRITHTDPRVVASCGAAAAALAYNVSNEEIVLGAFVDRVASAAGQSEPAIAEAVQDFPRTLSLPEYRALRCFETVALDDRYPPSDDGLSDYCVPVVLTALYYFLRSPFHYDAVVESCLRTGGHISTLAFLAGALSGALVGDDGLPENIIAGLVNAEEIVRLADRLHAAWLRRE